MLVWGSGGRVSQCYACWYQPAFLSNIVEQRPHCGSAHAASRKQAFRLIRCTMPRISIAAMLKVHCEQCSALWAFCTSPAKAAGTTSCCRWCSMLGIRHKQGVCGVMQVKVFAVCASCMVPAVLVLWLRLSTACRRQPLPCINIALVLAPEQLAVTFQPVLEISHAAHTTHCRRPNCREPEAMPHR
jgi:hypothetical protein